MDVIDLHRRAAHATAAIIDRVPADQLDAPTPCSRWTIRQVVEHLVSNNRTLVARVRDGSEVDGDDFAATAREFNETFADPAVQSTPFELGKVPTDGRGVVAMQLADVLVHGWDIGRGAGLDVTIDEDLAAAALRITAGIPDHVRGPDGPFGTAVPAPEDAPAQDRLLSFLGRDPAWAPA